MKLQITNIERSFGETDLRKLFEKFGVVSECSLVLDKVTGKSKGFGFVSFQDPIAASRAQENINGRLINGQKMKVKSLND